MPRKVLTLVAAWILFSFVAQELVTGEFDIYHIEELTDPQAVRGWDKDGLILADGRHVSIPGISDLPPVSAALSQATQRGVELGPDDRVYALVEIWHWCGNDRVKEHIARVDLGEMLTFLEVGTAAAPVDSRWTEPVQPGGNFTGPGWDLSEFHYFTMYHIEQAEQAQASRQ